MRLLLEYQSGPCPIAKIWLINGQLATVGRSQEADFPVEHDRFMSSLHFRVECRESGCWIRDLGSTNGTFLNGEKILETILRHGDVVLAGQTSFAVKLGDELAEDATPGGQAAAGDAIAVSEISAPAHRPTADLIPKIQRIDSPLTRTMPLAPTPVNRIELLCLEALNSPHPQKTWLSPGKSITVGRSDACDFCLPHDRALSGSHFRISCDFVECRVHDLESTGGTLVNGRRIRDAVIRDGDTITAGTTEFGVQVRYERADIPSDPSVPTFVHSPCASGVVLYQGCVAEPPALGVMQMLSQVVPVHLLVNFAGLDVALPSQPVYLLNWLPVAVAPQLSPVVMSGGELAEMMSLIEAAWRKNAVACVYSRLEIPQLLHHLRFAARGQLRAIAAPLPDHLLGAYRPADLFRVLTGGLPEFANFFFDGIDGVLIEPQSSEHWEVLGKKSFADFFERLGMVARRPSLSAV